MMGWDARMRGIQQLDKFTYALEMDEGKGRSVEEYSVNWPTSRTS